MAQDAETKLEHFRNMLQELKSKRPNDEELKKNIDKLWEAVQSSGLEEFKKHAKEIFGENGANLIVALAENNGISVDAQKKRWGILNKIWKRTVGKVFSDTKYELTSGNPYLVVGSLLSVVGKTWSALSEFWDEAQKEIPALKYADVPIKSAAIALYIKCAPILGIIKAAEFIGRSSIEYGKTKKFFHSLKVGARDTLVSIYNHFLRLTVGKKFHPALKQFGKTIGELFGADKKRAKEFAEFVKSQDVMKNMHELSEEQASMAAHKVYDYVKSKGEGSDVDIGLVSNIVIPSVAKGLDNARMKALLDAATEKDIASKLEKMPPTIKSMSIDRIVQATKVLADREPKEILQTSLNEIMKIKKTNLKVDDFGKYLQDHSPKLYKKLEGYFKQPNRPENFTIEQAAELLEHGPNLKKMNKTYKKEFMMLAGDFAFKKTLEKNLGKSAKRTKKWSEIYPHKTKKPSFAFLRTKKTHEQEYKEEKALVVSESQATKPK